MPRRWIRKSAAWLILALAGPNLSAAAPGGAADSPLAVVPASAPVVIQLRGIDRVRDRLKATLQAAAPDIGAMAAGQVDTMFGQSIEGRKLSSLAPQGPVFVALLELPKQDGGGEPAMAVFACVTKYADFRDTFLKDDERKALKSAGSGIDQTEINGTEVFLVDKKDWVAVTPKKDVAESLVKGGGGLGEKLAPELAATFLGNDVGVYVNLATVNSVYGDQIRDGREMFMGMMDQVPGMDKNQAEMVKKIYGGMFQAVMDGEAMVIGMDFRPDGIALNVQGTVGADTDSNKMLKGQSTVALDSIGKLPAGQMMYVGYEMSPEAARTLMGMMQGMAGAEGDAKKALDAALERLAAAGGRAAFNSNSYPVSGITFQDFDQPAKALAATIDMLKAFGEGSGYMGAMLKGKPEIVTDAQTFKDIKFTSVALSWDLDKMTEMIPGAGEEMKAYYQKLMGDGIKIWIGADDKRLIQVVAKDWPAAKEKLERFTAGEKTVGVLPAFQASRKQLPDRASMLAFVDAGPMANLMVESALIYLRGAPGLPFNLPEKFNPVKTDPAFIGTALSLQPRRGGMDVFIPVTAVQEMRKVIMQLIAGG
jgi:hypothetical protein